MNLVRWLRKNNKKVMAVVVIVIMFGFVGGTYISRLGQRRSTGTKTVAYYADNRKITNYDLVLARQELEILTMLKADDMLRSIAAPLSRASDLRTLLLGELLFSGSEISPVLINNVKQTIRLNQYRISDKQLNDIYRHSTPGEVYWLLLKSEADQAGIRISKEQAGKNLARVIPQITGATYSQLIGTIVDRRGIPEDRILETFSKLLAVLEYAKMVCSSENFTIRQIRQKISWENERIEVEFVKFDSAVFAEDQPEPTQQQLVEQFDKYKEFFAGQISEENPYGFGYKLADRVKLEYIAVKLDDVSKTVTAPTQEEAEEYYQRRIANLQMQRSRQNSADKLQFTEQVPSDPNDPNSPLTERTKSYAEMAGSISEMLLQNKIKSKAGRILQEAKTITEAGLEDLDTGLSNLSLEQLSKKAGDYKTTAEQLSEKYKVKIYTGQTGLLSAVDMQMDEYIQTLYVEGYRGLPVRLPQVVFAIDELAISELGPFDVTKPRMYENIGPVKDILGKITLVVRVVGAEKASEPDDINQTFSKNSLGFEQPDEKVYSVKEKVAEDLKKLAAMDVTKNKTQEFIEMAAKDSWQSCVEKFNRLYGQKTQKDEGEPNVFRLQSYTNLRRIPRETIETLAVQNAGNPVARFLANETKKESQLVEQLYSLVPADSETTDAVPLIVEFKPGMSYYCLKSISVKRLEKQQYEKIKTAQVYKEDVVQSQSLAAVHFGPENILKRMSFRAVKDNKQAADVNEPGQSEGTL